MGGKSVLILVVHPPCLQLLQKIKNFFGGTVGSGTFVAETVPGVLSQPEKRLEKRVARFLQEAAPWAADSASILAPLEKN
jgi:hypothetical protein